MAQVPSASGGSQPQIVSPDFLRELLAGLGHLHDQQVRNIVEALHGRGDLIASLHRLTPEQRRINAAITRVGARMGIEEYPTLLARVPRRNDCIGVTPPPGTVKIVIFHVRGATPVDITSSTRAVRLPQIVGASTVDGLDYLNARGEVIGSAGPERLAAPGEAECSNVPADVQKGSE